MLRTHTVLGLLTLPIVGLGLISAFPAPPPPELEFDRLSLILEINASDGDGEIVLDLKTDAQIARLEIEGPLGCDDDDDDDGRKVYSIRSNRDLGLGISQLLVETGEPDLETVLNAFPAGMYELSGKTLEGQRFRNTVELTHSLLAAPEILFPADGDDDIPVFGLVVQWVPNPGATSWLVELEREDDLPGKIVATLPAGTSTFAAPEGFLLPGVEYQVGVRAINADGNVTVSELTFVTQ